MAAALHLAAPAKVNLFLRVLAREESGYHQLETLFLAVDLSDDVLLEAASEGVQLTVEGAELGPTEENLAYRAARLYQRETGTRSGLRIHLRKRIPAGAGLGGGSSDAAAVLKGAERLLLGGLEPRDLLRLGASLGSDVPFFVSGAPAALAWGRGERLLPVPPPPPAPLLLVLPREPVPTPRAYAELDEDRRGRTEVSAGLIPLADLSSWTGLAALATNDFEASVVRRRPGLRSIRDELAATGPLSCMLSGSGSAFFAVYAGESERNAAARLLEGRVDARVLPLRGPVSGG